MDGLRLEVNYYSINRILYDHCAIMDRARAVDSGHEDIEEAKEESGAMVI
jgi:hypothetical protein